MCGIVGVVAQRDAYPILLEGLRRLEYRGYDSAGLATLQHGQIQQLRALGKVAALVDKVRETPLPGGVGIAHTRWATHGQPSERNAHPHQSNQRVAIVHNGIIENYQSLKQALIAAGYQFASETDSEVIAHLIHQLLEQGLDPGEALRQACARFEGAYATAVIDNQHPDQLWVTRHGSPLVIGLGLAENFVASDPLALMPVTRRFIFLEEGDLAQIQRDSIQIWDSTGQPVQRPVKEGNFEQDMGDKGSYRHYMLKEIFEQPNAISHTLEGRLSQGRLNDGCFGEEAMALFGAIQSVQIIACGTSYHAGLIARYWIEALAGLPCRVEIASEFRYRKPVVQPNCLFVTISQSGETADTLAALRLAKQRGYRASLAICNVPGSSLVRESQFSLLTRAGAEIGVASTKAFTTQLSALMLLVLALGRGRDISPEHEGELVQALLELPHQVEKTLALDPAIEKLAQDFAEKHHALFLGRGTHYPVAMEGALKLKEISYIHAEAYAAGELKHGPLALVDKDMPVLAVAPNNELLEKLKSNLEEVRARGGQLYVFADAEAGLSSDAQCQVMPVPHVHEALAPVVYTLPLQLLAYHVAVLKGTDVDQPRNLAKSVTVE